MDRHTPQQRSYNMSRVRSKNTLPERIIFKKLKEHKIRFRKHYSLPGKPDVAILKKRIVVFIDGEFWHGRRFKEWKDDLSTFWFKKIGDNIKRDRKNFRELRKIGWKVIRLWDKDIIKNPDREVRKILRAIESD